MPGLFTRGLGQTLGNPAAGLNGFPYTLLTFGGILLFFTIIAVALAIWMRWFERTK
jgi:hypothetical protein